MSYEMYEMAQVGIEEFEGLDRPFEVDDDECIDWEEADDFFFDGMFGE